MISFCFYKSLTTIRIETKIGQSGALVSSSLSVDRGHGTSGEEDVRQDTADVSRHHDHPSRDDGRNGRGA